MPIQSDRIQGTPTAVAVKQACRVAAAADVVLSGLQTIDAVALAESDRVLVTNNTDTTENGIWVAGASSWQRADDFDGNMDVVRGTFIPVYSGSAESGWYEVTTVDPIVIGTSSITFTRWLLTAG